MVGLVVTLMAAFMYSALGAVGGRSLAFFDFIPAGLIRNLGIGVMALWVLAAVGGFVRMARLVSRDRDFAIRSVPRLWSAIRYAVVEHLAADDRSSSEQAASARVA